MSPRGYKYEPSGEVTEKVGIEKAEVTETKQQEKLNEATQSPQTFVVKTELDAYISDRIQTQPKTLDEIKLRDVELPHDGTHALTLPREIKNALEKRGFTGYWINKRKRAIDRAIDDRGWTIFNRVYFPEVGKHYFTANGTFEIGDAILGFMPAKRAEKLRSLPGQLSAERIKNLPIERYKDSKGEEKIGYYKPAYTAEPDGEMMRKGVGLFAQPDLPTETTE